MTPSGRFRWGAGMIAALGLVLAACSAPVDPRGTLVIGLYTEPTAIDPQREYFWETFRVSRNVYEPLVAEDLSHDQGVPGLVPALATGWTSSPDATTWTFTLRQGVRFHDGTPFDASAVDVNVRRFTDPTFELYDRKSAAQLSARFSDLAQAGPVDAFTYRFRFHRPYLGFPRLLAQSIGSPLIASPAALHRWGNDGLADHPTGTGPYTFVERVPNDHITLVRSPGYWGPPPRPARLVFRIIANNPSRLAALVSGEIDILTRVQPTDVEPLERQGFVVPPGQPAQLNYLAFNFRNRFAQDPAVRRAIALAIDREGIARDVYDGYARALSSFLNPGNEAYTPATRDQPYDPAAARAELARAGHRPGSVHFTVVTDLAGQPEGEYIANDLAAVGIRADVTALERATYTSRSSNPEPDDAVNLSEYGGTYPEWVQEGFASGVRSKGGEPFMDTPRVRAAFDAARYTADPGRRLGLWQDADRAVLAETAFVPTVSMTRYYALSPRVRGFVWPRTNWYDLAPVWLAG